MTKQIYKKSALLSTVLLIVFFSLAYGSTVELQSVADGSRSVQKLCYPYPVPPYYHCVYNYHPIAAGICLENWTTGDRYDEYGSVDSTRTGIIEFDIASVKGLFQTAQISATLTFTISYVSNVLATNAVYLSDMKDENENGIIEVNDTDVQGTIGTATFSNQVQPGYTITFDVTQALTHHIFDANQSTFSGFVLNSAHQYDVKPQYCFYDHTSLENAPRLTISGPTLITLSSFTAAARSGRVILDWSTESETDNAGFNIYRAESESGAYIKINDSFIPSQGSSTQGASYEFIDTNVQNRKTYYYKLEDIDLSGTATMHGPVNATPRLIYGMKK